MTVNCKLILYADNYIIMDSYKDPKVNETKLDIELNSKIIGSLKTDSHYILEIVNLCFLPQNANAKEFSDFNVVLNGTNTI